MTDAEPSQREATTRAAAVLEQDEAREAAQSRTSEQVIFPDDLLPGVDAEQMSLREGLRRGGITMFVVLTLLNSLDELEGAAIYVLAPEIRATFGISEGAIVFITTASAAFFVLGAVPMGWLCDRVKRRVPIVGFSGLFFGFFVFLSGLATSAFMLFWTRFGTGVAKASTIPVHSSLIADNYPIGVRARMSALNDMIGHGLALASPVLVGAIAVSAGGTEGWRWAWFILGIPVSIVALVAFFMKEPPAGAVREGPRPRRADRRRRPTRRRSPWRRRSPGSSASARSGPCSSPSAPWASGCSASRCWPRSTSTTPSGSPTSSSAACSSA